MIAILLVGVYTRGADINLYYLKHALAGILYFHTLIYRYDNPVNVVTWSLEVEIQFYILAPVFALLFRIRNAVGRRSVMVALIAGCGIVQSMFMLDSAFLQHTIAYSVQYFLAGLLLADFYLLGWKERSGWWDGFAVVGWCVYFGAPRSGWTQTLFPFLLFLLCAAALRGRFLRFFFSNESIAVVGGMCYSIYLLHLLLIAVIFKFTRYMIVPHDYLATFLLQIVVTLIPVVMICAVYYRWLERLCMDPAWPAKLRDWVRSIGPEFSPALQPASLSPLAAQTSHKRQIRD